MRRNIIIGAASVVVGGALGVGVAGLPEHVSSDITIEGSVPSSVSDDGAPVATGLTTVAPTTAAAPPGPTTSTSLTITTGASGGGSAATTPG